MFGDTTDKGIIFKNAIPAGIEENYLVHNFIIYPNLATNHINIKLPLSEKVQIEKYTVIGQLVLYKEVECNTDIEQVSSVNVEILTKGVYIVKISTGKSIYSK